MQFSKFIEKVQKWKIAKGLFQTSWISHCNKYALLLLVYKHCNARTHINLTTRQSGGELNSHYNCSKTTLTMHINFILWINSILYTSIKLIFIPNSNIHVANIWIKNYFHIKKLDTWYTGWATPFTDLDLSLIKHNFINVGCNMYVMWTLLNQCTISTQHVATIFLTV